MTEQALTEEAGKMNDIKGERVKPPNGITVTLCMIVKDEEAIIERCLHSMVKYIDRYDITDTGSTDKTIEIIKEFFDSHDIPGEVHEMEWKGFGESRTQSLRNCDGKADYAWVIDADDFVEGDFTYPEEMNLHGYSLKIQRGEFVWYRNQIFKTDIGWRYEGVLHEYAHCPTIPGPEQKLGRVIGDNYHLEARTEGKRNIGISPEDKYTNDAKVLIDALENKDSPHYKPDDERYTFYLGQSWFDAGNIEKALEAYEKRVPLGGWEEEVYYTLYRIGICKAILEKTEMEVAKAFIDAWAYRPIRCEPLHQLARLYRTNNKQRHAYLYAKQAAQTPYPDQDILFIEGDVYKWKALDELAATAFYMFNFEEGYRACAMLCDAPEGLIPDNEKTRIIDNWRQYEEQVKKVAIASGEQWPVAGVPTPPAKTPLATEFTLSRPNVETIEVKTDKKGTKVEKRKRFKKRKKK